MSLVQSSYDKNMIDPPQIATEFISSLFISEKLPA